jgi:hypothetical protein
MNVEFTPSIPQLQAEFRKLPLNLQAKHMAAALGRAIVPGVQALKKATPKGPTGNLRAAVTKKTKRYRKSGTGIALAGYAVVSRGFKSDKNDKKKGNHAHFLEFGTQERFTKRGRIASSLSKRGKFAIANTGGKLTTDTRFSFFKSAPKGQFVSTGRMPIGGSTGKPPIFTAFKQSESQMKSLVGKEMANALQKAINESLHPREGKR